MLLLHHRIPEYVQLMVHVIHIGDMAPVVSAKTRGILLGINLFADAWHVRRVGEFHLMMLITPVTGMQIVNTGRLKVTGGADTLEQHYRIYVLETFIKTTLVQNRFSWTGSFNLLSCIQTPLARGKARFQGLLLFLWRYQRGFAIWTG